MGVRYEAVIFDFGGVLVSSPFEMIRNMGHEAGADGEEILELMLGPYAEDTDHPWHRVERGEIPMSEYGLWLMEEMGKRGITLPRRAMQDMQLHEPVVARAKELRDEGYKTAVLTNNAREVGDDWRAMLPIDDLFDTVVDSCLVGMRKPNPAIYRHTAEVLGVDPHRCVFLDDAPGNVLGAEATGMRAILVGLDFKPALDELDEVLTGARA